MGDFQAPVSWLQPPSPSLSPKGQIGNNLGREEGLLDGLDGKESACDAGDLGSIPGLGRSPGEGDAKNREEQTGNSSAALGQVLGPPQGMHKTLVFFIPEEGHLKLL